MEILFSKYQLLIEVLFHECVFHFWDICPQVYVLLGFVSELIHLLSQEKTPKQPNTIWNNISKNGV